MPFHVEKQYFENMTPELLALNDLLTHIPKEDALARREIFNSAPQMPYIPSEGLEAFTFHTKGASSEKLEMIWVTKKGSKPGNAVVYFHGGGLILGSASGNIKVVDQYVLKTGVPFLTVDYGLAPENPGTIPAEDGIAAIKWLINHAAEFGINPDRIAVMGDSAGGCVAAATAILARNLGIHLAKQILIYPMLDDRTTEFDENLRDVEPYLAWKYVSNYAGWFAHVGEKLGDEDNSPIAVPARNRDFHDMADAYLEVGELDIFRDEGVKYAENFWKTGISAELHVWEGTPHGFDQYGFTTELIEKALWFRHRAITSF